jgi:RNA polymerase sigma factor (sigma-70 family)
MSARYARECDCGWRSDTCRSERDAIRLAAKHMCSQTEQDNWLGMAYVIVQRMKIYGEMREEAMQEAALAGWIAAEKWSPSGGMSRRNWIWRAMERGLVDWVRVRLGRSGRRHAWESTVQYLDEPVAGNVDLTLARTLASPEDCYEQVEALADLEALVNRAALTEPERQWLGVFLADEPQKILMDAWSVSEGRVSQIKRDALRKMRAVA